MAFRGEVARKPAVQPCSSELARGEHAAACGRALTWASINAAAAGIHRRGWSLLPSRVLALVVATRERARAPCKAARVSASSGFSSSFNLFLLFPSSHLPPRVKCCLRAAVCLVSLKPCGKEAAVVTPPANREGEVLRQSAALYAQRALAPTATSGVENDKQPAVQLGRCDAEARWWARP